MLSIAKDCILSTVVVFLALIFQSPPTLGVQKERSEDCDWYRSIKNDEEFLQT